MNLETRHLYKSSVVGCLSVIYIFVRHFNNVIHVSCIDCLIENLMENKV